MKRRVSTRRLPLRRRRTPRQYDSEDSAPTPHPQKQRKRAKVDPSFIVSDEPPVPSSQEEDEHIRKLDKSGALSHVIGSQSILSQELMDMSSSQRGNLNMLEEPVNAACLLCTTEELDDEDVEEETTPDFREEVEPPISSSQLSFLIGAARALESDNEDDDQNHASLQTPPPKTPAAVTTRPPLTTRPLPSTKNPAATKPPSGSTNKTLETATNTLAVPPTTISKPPPSATKTTPTAIVVGQTPTIITKAAPLLSRKNKRKSEREAQQNEARSLAQQAASLAAQAIASPEVSKQLLLSMVFVRTNPRSPPSTWPPKGSIIPEGFFWATYPPLETTLKRHMRRYYDLSVEKCQSKEQQAFNNDMVTIVRAEAYKFGWAFSTKFSDKGLRDRVRCYFKTHIQNAKKRLRTMLMNPTKRANTKALINHLEMIQTYSNKKEKVNKKSATKNQMARKKERKTDARRVEGLDQDTRDAVTQVVR